MVPPLFKGRRAAHDSETPEAAPAAVAGNGSSTAAASASAPAAILRVQLLRARGLAAMDRNGKSDPFVIVSIPGASARRGNSDYRRRSAVRRQTCEPEWSGKDEALFDFDIAPEWLAGAGADSREASAERELERSDADEGEPSSHVAAAAADPHLIAPLATPRPKPSRRISDAAGKILTAPVRIGARGAAAGARGAVAGARAVGRRRKPRPMRNPGGSGAALQSPAGPQVGALEFVVWDKDKWTANDYMGEVSLPIEDWCKGDCAWESQEVRAVRMREADRYSPASEADVAATRLFAPLCRRRGPDPGARGLRRGARLAAAGAGVCVAACEHSCSRRRAGAVCAGGPERRHGRARRGVPR
jgi:hypothetical protein